MQIQLSLSLLRLDYASNGTTPRVLRNTKKWVRVYYFQLIGGRYQNLSMMQLML